jgi:hypothetical protein
VDIDLQALPTEPGKAIQLELIRVPRLVLGRRRRSRHRNEEEELCPRYELVGMFRQSEQLFADPEGRALELEEMRKNTSGRIKSMSEPTGKYSITMPRDIAEAARARSGPSGLSGYVAAAVARQIERDNLNELIAVAEAEHGPVTEEEVRARREELRRARTEQGHPRSRPA